MKEVCLSALTDQPLLHNARIKKRVMIAPGELDFLTNFSQAVFPVGEAVSSHHHENMAEVFFVQSGNGEIKIADELVRLKPGVCVLVEAKETHSLINTGSDVLVITYFGIKTHINHTGASTEKIDAQR